MNNKNCIFLIGFMASGKSTLGKPLAHELGLDYIDTDTLIEKQKKMPISQIFDKLGEEVFRREEEKVLKKICLEYKNKGAVISTGGGLPCYGQNLNLMKQNGIVVYIKVSVEEIVKRVKDSSLRPVFYRMEKSGNIKEEIKKLLSQREVFYSRADVKVLNSDAQCPEIVVKRIIEKIKLLKKC